MKTLSLALILAVPASFVRADDTLLNHVSECVGRLSAQMEHHWLFPDQPTQSIETQRSHLIDILEALTTNENARQILSNRIDSKMAHASLLTRAAFSKDPKMARWAEARVQTQLKSCGDIALVSPADDLEERVSISRVRSGQETVNQSAVHITRSQ